MPVRGSRTRLIAGAGAILVLSLALSACNEKSSDSNASPGGSDQTTSSDPGSGGDGGTATSDAPAADAVITANIESGTSDVAVDTAVVVNVADGTFEDVLFHVHGNKKPLDGKFNADKTIWTASELLEPGTKYVVKSKATNADGVAAKERTKFATQDLTLDQQTYASLTPLEDETVGVGMPVIVHFDIPVKNKAIFERHMKVTANPPTVGSWSWINSNEAHWRPKTFWKTGTDVHVDVNVNGLNAGDGIYGQMSRKVDFKIGDSVIMKADLQSDEMKVLVNGALARTIPITGGKAGFETRSGTKLIVEKFESKRMDAATVGIQPGDPNYYNIPDVKYAQRVTFTGEFLHAAPWSTYAQGSYNVSHGCVGMSTDNAAWLFSLTHRGDPVVVTGTDRGLEQGNGWTDWDESFKEFRAGSALAKP